MEPVSEERLAELKAEFARLQKRLFLAFVLIIAVGCAWAWCGEKNPVLGVPCKVWFVSFLLLLVCYNIYWYRKWRCPACGHPFTSRFLGMEYRASLLVRTCGNCGVRLV